MIITRKKDVVWNYLGTLMNMGSNFFMLPFMFIFLSSDEIGLWQVFLSVAVIVNLFDFGFAPTLARNIAYSWSGVKELTKIGGIKNSDGNIEPNIQLLKKVILTCKKIYFIIALLALTSLLTIGTFYILYITKEMAGTSNLISWFIFILAVFLNLYFGYFFSLLKGVGAITESSIANVISSLIYIIASVIMLRMGIGLVAISIAYLIKGIIFRLMCNRFFNKYQDIGNRLKSSNVKVGRHEMKKTFQIIWFNAWRDGLVTLTAFLTNQASTIICSLFVDLTQTGIYSISLQMVTALALIAGTLYSTFQPALQANFINKNMEKSKKLMATAMTFYICLYWIGIIALILLGIPLLNLIKPDIVFNIPILLGLSLYVFLLRYHSYYASFISNTNKVPYMKAFIVSGLLGAILSLILVIIVDPHNAVWGLIIGQILAQLYNNWKWPHVVMKCMKINQIGMFQIGMKEMIKILKGRKVAS